MYDLSNPGVVKSLLEPLGFKFSKGLGQNFLINPHVCPKMAELCGADPEFCALEIGPGVGVLTQELAKRFFKVAAVELDDRLKPVLLKTLGALENVEIIYGDAMKLDLAALIKEQFGGRPTVVCANLPYYITSPVVMRLLESRLAVESITVMVQKEAAQRLCAAPGSKSAGAVSYAVSYYAEPHVLFSVPSGSFMPQPKVDSSVIRLDIRKSPCVTVANEKLLFRTIRASFGQRRKTLENALASGLHLSKEDISAAMARAGIHPGVRGETLDLTQFAALSAALDPHFSEK